MATLYATEVADRGSVPAGKAINQYQNVVAFPASIALASQGTSDTIVLADVPAGYTFLYGVINTDTSLGTSTVAIGVSGTTGKYRAAAVHTATNAPTLFGPAAAQAKLTAAERIFVTIAVAALPASGNLEIALYFGKQ